MTSGGFFSGEVQYKNSRGSEEQNQRALAKVSLQHRCSPSLTFLSTKLTCTDKNRQEKETITPNLQSLPRAPATVLVSTLSLHLNGGGEREEGDFKQLLHGFY